MNFLSDYNKSKFESLLIMENEMLRQYESNLNKSKSLLIDSNRRFKEETARIILENETLLNERMKLYKKKMGLKSVEVLDRILLADDYETLGVELEQYRKDVLDEFSQKYRDKLDIYLQKNEKKVGDFYNHTEKKLESIILGKMSKIKSMESQYISNIKKMYKETMDELHCYKEEGFDVIVVEKKCLRNHDTDRKVESMKEDVETNMEMIKHYARISTDKFENIQEKMTDLTVVVRESIRETSEKTRNLDLKIEGFKEKIAKGEVLKCTQDNANLGCLNSNYNPLPCTTIDLRTNSTTNQIKPISGFNIGKHSDVKDYGAMIRTRILENQTKLELRGFHDSKPINNPETQVAEISNTKTTISEVKTILPNYPILIGIDKEYAEFYETKTIARNYGKTYRNIRGYIKGKIMKNNHKSAEPLKTLFEYTHKSKQWVEKMKEILEEKLQIELPEIILNENEHETESLGVGYFYDENVDNEFGIPFDSEGEEIVSD